MTTRRRVPTHWAQRRCRTCCPAPDLQGAGSTQAGVPAGLQRDRGLPLEAHRAGDGIRRGGAVGDGPQLLDVLWTCPKDLVAHALFGPLHDFREVEDSYLDEQKK